MPDPILKVDEIGVRFGDFQALTAMSIAVKPNTIHALIGPNGAGKTTFFNAVTGVRPPNSGKIAFDGHVVTKASAHRRVHYGMARSFQVTNIYPNLTVAENLRLAVQARHHSEGWVFWRSPAARGDIAAEVEEIMGRVGILDRAGTRSGDLSHGAQRSLEIGMALGAQPKMICLDEPLAGMGIDDVHRTKELIVSLKERMAVLLIEHNMSVVLSISDFITVMAQGKKIAEDTPERVRNDPAVRQAYLGSQA
ncbi:ABC transporter ATP-binding protein [Enterovirga rhinocerotis]|uniref:Amino acid/amide ABC transporter ATP-binding protein 1 (HAAT family) n=1 Tax=Enterovirga rhinocerotis TaxID=1339210 RepID=A0A4R7BW67_9HYPH|nr:ABC transporter ATP-binding protein [Enterovirga rhinocerotis]TDR89713.1 amino acid/amide ABC transporter ATP-binding protein 1 (HAAT family) [Enterovirga rhinocerotis]